MPRCIFRTCRWSRRTGECGCRCAHALSNSRRPRIRRWDFRVARLSILETDTIALTKSFKSFTACNEEFPRLGIGPRWGSGCRFQNLENRPPIHRVGFKRSNCGARVDGIYNFHGVYFVCYRLFLFFPLPDDSGKLGGISVISKARYDYPTTRLPVTFSKLAGLSTHIYCCRWPNNLIRNANPLSLFFVTII